MRLVEALAFGGLALTSAAASEPVPDLKNAAPDRVIRALTYCRGTYSVTTIAGSVQIFKEFDVRLKTDASDKGPEEGGQ